jgi:phospholipid/cholesterol/gamma-HCH transport system substrate-binding protein
MAAAAALALTALASTLVRHSDADKVVVHAAFADASPLVAGNKVQMHGVEVGVIGAVNLVGRNADVVMTVDRSVLPLHSDASAKIEPVSLLGERFVALEQGSPAAPEMAQPYQIPLARTGSSVDLDQLLNTFDDPTSTALAAMVTTLGEGVSGQGVVAAQALRQLAPTLHHADQLTALLDQQNALIDHLVVSAQRTTSAAAGPMDPLVDSAEQVLHAVSDNRAAVDGSLSELPGTLSSFRQTLGALGTTADNTTQVLAGVRPLTDRLVDVSRELHDFSDAARPALEPLPDVLHRVDSLLDEARPLVHDLHPAAGDLNSVAGSLRTLGQQVFTHPAGVPSQLEDVMTGAADWAMGTAGHDGVSHYFRGLAVVTPSPLLHAGTGVAPPLTKQPLFNPIPKDPNGRSGYPGTAPLPMMPALPNPDGANNQTHPVHRQDPTSASGLTQKQESDMFDQLLGGGK